MPEAAESKAAARAALAAVEAAEAVEEAALKSGPLTPLTAVKGAASTGAKLEPSMLRERFMLVAATDISSKSKIAFYSMAHARFLVVSDDGESLVESPMPQTDDAVFPADASWAPRASFMVFPAAKPEHDAPRPTRSYVYNAVSEKFLRIDPATGTLGLTPLDPGGHEHEAIQLGGHEHEVIQLGGHEHEAIQPTPGVSEGASFEIIYASVQDPDEYHSQAGDELQRASEMLDRRAAAEAAAAADADEAAEPLEGSTYVAGDLVVLFGVAGEAFLTHRQETETVEEPGHVESGIVRSDAATVGAGFIIVSRGETSDESIGLCSLQTGGYLTVSHPETSLQDAGILEMIDPEGDGEYTACEAAGMPVSTSFKVVNTFSRAQVAFWHVETRRFIDMRPGESGSAVSASVIFREPKLERGPLHHKYLFKLVDLDSELAAKPLAPGGGSKCLEYVSFDNGEGHPAMESCSAMNTQRWQHDEKTQQLVVRHDQSCLIAHTLDGDQADVSMGRCSSPGPDGTVEASQQWLWEPEDGHATPIRSAMNAGYCLEAIPGDESLLKPTTHADWTQVRPAASGTKGRTFWSWQPLNPDRTGSYYGDSLCKSEDEPFCKCTSPGNCFEGYCFMVTVGEGVWMWPFDMSRCIHEKPNLRGTHSTYELSAGSTSAVEQDDDYTQWCAPLVWRTPLRKPSASYSDRTDRAGRPRAAGTLEAARRAAPKADRARQACVSTSARLTSQGPGRRTTRWL